MSPHSDGDKNAQPVAASSTPPVTEADAVLPRVPLHPAPWQLRGSGYVLAVQMPEDVLDHAAFVPSEWVPRRRGRTSYVLFADYQASDCAPYRELLVAPATFAFDEGTFAAISRIFVSTYDSVVNGRNNWGIPKDRAEFERQHDAARATDLIRVSRDGHTFAELELRAYGPTLPVRTWLLLPRLRTIVQHWQGKSYRITLSARGHARLASLTRWQFDPEYFPDLARGRVLAASYLPDFDITFPVAAVNTLPTLKARAP